MADLVTVGDFDHGAAEVQAHDIPWSSAPMPRIEDLNALARADYEILEYVTDLQAEARTLRELLHEALASLRRQTDSLARAARVADQLRRELRALRGTEDDGV
jgi:hypothetical protein